FNIQYALTDFHGPFKGVAHIDASDLETSFGIRLHCLLATIVMRERLADCGSQHRHVHNRTSADAGTRYFTLQLLDDTARDGAHRHRLDSNVQGFAAGIVIGIDGAYFDTSGGPIWQHEREFHLTTLLASLQQLTVLPQLDAGNDAVVFDSYTERCLQSFITRTVETLESNAGRGLIGDFRLAILPVRNTI